MIRTLLLGALALALEACAAPSGDFGRRPIIVRINDRGPLVRGGGLDLSRGAARAETCRASWYGSESGARTANGERFDPAGLTAAHRTLPFGTRLRVTFGRRSILVRVNDRGPFVRGRCLDLSLGAARALGMLQRGTARVSIQRSR